MCVQVWAMMVFLFVFLFPCRDVVFFFILWSAGAVAAADAVCDG